MQEIIWNKDIIEKALTFAGDEEYILLPLPLTKEKRTRSQECTYYRCFTLIWDKMWMSIGEVKMNCLKALFWVTETKFWGVTYENAIKPHTSELSKEEAILLIETLIEFWKKLKIKDMVTSREMLDLFNYE